MRSPLNSAELRMTMENDRRPTDSSSDSHKVTRSLTRWLLRTGWLLAIVLFGCDARASFVNVASGMLPTCARLSSYLDWAVPGIFLLVLIINVRSFWARYKSLPVPWKQGAPLIWLLETVWEDKPSLVLTGIFICEFIAVALLDFHVIPFPRWLR